MKLELINFVKLNVGLYVKEFRLFDLAFYDNLDVIAMIKFLSVHVIFSQNKFKWNNNFRKIKLNPA